MTTNHGKCWQSTTVSFPMSIYKVGGLIWAVNDEQEKIKKREITFLIDLTYLGIGCIKFIIKRQELTILLDNNFIENVA
jgi:hypothetical protein